MREYRKETDNHYVSIEIYELADEYFEYVNEERVVATETKYDIWLGIYGENKRDLGCSDLGGQTRKSLTLLRDAINELLSENAGAPTTDC